jgi:integrase
MKKIRGVIHYFGNWARRVNGKLERVPGDGWEEALAEYKTVADDLHAGRTPQPDTDRLTVAALCNHFLTAKLRQFEARELSSRMFEEYNVTTDMMVVAFGKATRVDALTASDFARLREAMVKKWGPHRVTNGVTRTKTVCKYGFESGLIDRPLRYGQEFKPPSRSVLRRHRAKSSPKMVEAVELRLVLDALAGREIETGQKDEGGKPARVRLDPDPALLAMILLGVNAGFGNHDCASLPLSAVNLDSGWVEFPRPKTGIGRRCPLWPETVLALRAAIASRPKPAGFSDVGLVFLTYRGKAWVRTGEKSRSDYLSIRFNAMTKSLGLHRSGLGFYTLRHVFRTVADAARDIPAVRSIMGHVDASIDAAYRERIDDARLVAVVEHVRGWLFAGKAEG